MLCTQTRPRKLHITRFPINSKARLLRCSSSPHKVIKLCGDPVNSIVKDKAVPSVIVAALMNRLSCPAVLGIGHDRDFLSDFYRLLSDCQKTLPIYPYILKAK